MRLWEIDQQVMQIFRTFQLLSSNLIEIEREMLKVLLRAAEPLRGTQIDAVLERDQSCGPPLHPVGKISKRMVLILNP